MLDEELRNRVILLIREARPEDALALLAERYNVEPPRLKIGTVKGHRKVAGCYVPREKTIYLSSREMASEPFVVLHEFYHYLRSIEGEFGGSERHAKGYAREFQVGQRTPAPDEKAA